MGKGHYTQGSSVEYNDGARIIGGAASALVYSGTLPAEQTVASLTPTLLTLAAGVEEVGGKVTVQPEEVTLSVAAGTPMAATITLAPGLVTLKAGEATLTLNAVEGITLSFPGGTFQLGLAGQLTINAVQMQTTATSYELTATALTESVAGSAERTAAAAMFT
ncbi:MAG: hypothetical protein U0797_29945 [Gemmataceae bacterium]